MDLYVLKNMVLNKENWIAGLFLQVINLEI